MGSLRRISLRSAHSLQREHDSINEQCRGPSPVMGVPPVPSVPHTRDARSVSSTREHSASATSPTVEALQVDLASPTGSSPQNWPSSASQRRSGEVPVLSHSKSSSFATSSSLSQSAPVSRLSSASHVASLGRASPLPSGAVHADKDGGNGAINVLRRSSLGDLKIPSRISRAQDGLKRDLGRVREFASRVERKLPFRFV